MPRTKVSKNSKRNRDAANREEKIRKAENHLDEYLETLDRKGQDYIAKIDLMFDNMITRINSSLLNMKMRDFWDLGYSRFEDYRQNLALQVMTPLCNSTLAVTSNSSNNSSVQQSSLTQSTKIINPNDEGYLTEDSTTGSASAVNPFVSSTLAQPSLAQLRSVASAQHRQLLRTPGGPSASARARRPRRSRSACSNDDFGSALKPKLTGKPSDRTSRSKVRTPMTNRAKAFSADRTPKVRSNRSCSPQSPPNAILRWPKPGEIVVSKCGSPVVAQVMSDKFANVNIPVRNGVLSLQPKKISDINKDVIESIDPITLSQIKTLHENLNIIMKMANKALSK